ncbi:hypothetical protein CYY_009981 [Polysphondylium violaceum]|uniref:Uncharacterized protein n=1 Tax=Polysphondylium violaceum TaxID=133409 RepID=A0A8J4PSL3_9MYCE|nr:hypothetical protein CYY_009981 [Polysphondylium violaceum]
MNEIESDMTDSFYKIQLLHVEYRNVQENLVEYVKYLEDQKALRTKGAKENKGHQKKKSRDDTDDDESDDAITTKLANTDLDEEKPLTIEQKLDDMRQLLDSILGVLTLILTRVTTIESRLSTIENRVFLPPPSPPKKNLKINL